MSVLVNFAMFPTDKGTSKSESVSKVIEFVRNSGLSYKLSPMATTFEAEKHGAGHGNYKRCL